MLVRKPVGVTCVALGSSHSLTLMQLEGLLVGWAGRFLANPGAFMCTERIT